jgi:DNA-binding MarR family transcriptional regulator
MEDPAREDKAPDLGAGLVDEQLEVWGRELPTLDLETEGIVEADPEARAALDRSARETLERFDLMPRRVASDGPSSLRRPALPRQAGKLAKHLGLSSGAMTNRLDNMERRGLLRRLDDPDDRQGRDRRADGGGQELWERRSASRRRRRRSSRACCDEDEKARLNDLLRRWCGRSRTCTVRSTSTTPDASEGRRGRPTILARR